LTTSKRHPFIHIALLCLCLLLTAGNKIVHAETEPYNTGWQLINENNLFQRYMKDRDYTAGIAFSVSGSRAQSGWLNIDFVRDWFFDKLPKPPNIDSTTKKHSVQYGMVLFTPDDISATQPIVNDRPFASLIYISNTELTLNITHRIAYRSSLTLGFLGLNIAGEIQRVLHTITGSDSANGWHNQISAGGEPTAMLTFSMQNNAFANNNHQLSSHLEANAGFSTDVNAGLNWRWGKLNTPWWSFNPSHYEYIGSAPTAVKSISSKAEFYVFATINLKYRLYSSILQGQFGDSKHRLSSDQIEHFLTSLTVGTTYEFGNNLRLSLSARTTSAEIKGPNARPLRWASLTISQGW